MPPFRRNFSQIHSIMSPVSSRPLDRFSHRSSCRGVSLWLWY